MTATASMTTAGERVRYVSGTTDTVGGLTTQVSALVIADAVPMTATSTISIQGTFILAKGQANIQSRFSMDFFVLMIPTTISASFAITKAEVSVRKPADFRLSAASSLTARGGYVKTGSAAVSATSSFSCSTTAVARATVLYYRGWTTGSTLRLPLYGNVNATVEWGGGRTHRYPVNLLNGAFVPQNTPGSTAYYYSDTYRGMPYLGGGYKQNITYNTPGVKTFTVPSAQSVTQLGQQYIGPNDFDGFVIVKGQVDYLGALVSEDARGFDGSTGAQEGFQYPYLTEVLAWGDGIKGFRNLGRGNPSSGFQLEYISPNFPASMTELREAFGKRMTWNRPTNLAPTAPSDGPTTQAYKIYLDNLEWFNRLPIKNVVENMNTSGITTMAGCFKNNHLGFDLVTSTGPAPNYTQIRTAYYLDLSGWNTSNVTSMKEMFQTTYNPQITTAGYIPKGLGNWNTSLVTDFSYMFNGATYYSVSTNFSSAIDRTIDISGWNTSSATTMKAMFGGEATPSNLGGGNPSAAVATNASFGSLSGWNTANVTDMSFMFANYGIHRQTYTQPNPNTLVPTASLGVSTWNTGNVTTMKGMFIAFGGWADDLSSWNTGKVTDFSFMFSIPDLVSGGYMNPNVSSWNTSSATNMMSMFMGNSGFNRPMTRSGNIWNTSKVTNMTYMLWSLGNQNELFNQNLSSWCVPLIATQPTGFDQGRGNTWTLQRPVWGTCP
jgi:surface protein